MNDRLNEGVGGFYFEESKNKIDSKKIDGTRVRLKLTR